MKLGWAVLVLSASACAPPASAQIYVNASCEDERIVVRAFGQDVAEDPTRIGYDLYRFAVGSCEPRTKITDEMFEDAAGNFTLDFVDETARPNVIYTYVLVGVNEAQEPYDLPLFSWGWASCGEAPVAVGRIDDRPDTWWLDFDTCENWCTHAAPLLTQVPEDLAVLVEWYGHMDVILYGSIVNHEFDGPLMYADRWAPSDCSVTPVTHSPWGEIKQLFR